MKKVISLLPLAVAVALTGCSSTTESNVVAEQTNAQPAWQAYPSSGEFQTNQMPNYNAPAQPAYPQPMPANTVDYNSSVNVNISETAGNCQIIRDASGRPIYKQMTKGCYSAETYTVGPQDTLYFISFLVGKTADEIAALNHIGSATRLTVGQILRVR